jgi:hypothetical protein
MHKLVRNYHVDGANHSMRCAICGEEDEYTDHIYTCTGNMTGRGLTLAAIADTIADEYATDDGPIDITEWMPDSAVETLATSRHMQRMNPWQPTKPKPSRIVLEAGQNTQPIGRSLQAYAARMQAERQGRRPKTCRETAAWEYTANWQRPWSELATEIESMERDNAEMIPHGLMRILQSNMHFDTQVTDRYIGSYPGAAVHKRWQNWQPSDDTTGDIDNVIISLSTPPTADMIQHMEEMGASIAQSTKAKRMTAIVPCTQRWSGTTATHIVEFAKNALPITESTYYKGDTSDTTPSRYTWQMLIWENHAAKAMWPLTTALELQVTRWLKKRVVTAQNEEHKVSLGLWNPGVSKGRKAKYGWEHAPAPPRYQHRATAWRLLPLTLLGWIDTTPLMTDNEQKIYAAALNTAGKAWENEAVRATALPTECDIMRGTVPLEAAERLGHYLKVTNTSKSGETTAAAKIAIKIAMTALRGTKQILWRHRNKLHHIQVQSAEREDLKWLRHLKRGAKAGDSNEIENDMPASQVTTKQRKMTNFYPVPKNKEGAIPIILSPCPRLQPDDTETPPRTNTDGSTIAKRKAGRPPGSKNKTKQAAGGEATPMAIKATTRKPQTKELDKGQARLTMWIQPKGPKTTKDKDTPATEPAATPPPIDKQLPTDRPPPMPPPPTQCKGKGTKGAVCNCKQCARNTK